MVLDRTSRTLRCKLWHDAHRFAAHGSKRAETNCCQDCCQAALRRWPKPPRRLEMNSKSGGPGWNRTNDQPIMSRPL